MSRPPAHRVWPPADRREAITTHREGGWIATGQCGRPHLVGRGWSWWQCRPCKRIEATQRLSRAQSDRLALFYPDGRFRAKTS